MDALAVAAVFGGVVAEQTEIKEIGRVREEFEGREVAFIQWSGIGPHPADAVFFEEPNDLRTVPAGMPEFDGETKIARELLQEIAQHGTAFFRRERGRKLQKDNLKLGRERFHRAQKRSKLR